MIFKEHQENENLISRLDNVVKNDKVSHAYIFEGANCIDKKTFAQSFVKGILCPDKNGENCGRCGICHKIDHDNHEDITYIAASGNSIKDSDIVQMQDKLKTRPVGDRNIVIIENSDMMTLRAQNRLLKTLEEPPGRSVIILLSENMENLVQTILSRCVKYRINIDGSDSYAFMMETSRKIAKMTLDRVPFYKLKTEAESIAKSTEDTAAFLDGLQVVYRDILMEKSKGISLYKDSDLIRNIHAVENARKQIKDGVSAVYAIKNLFLKIGG